MNEHCDHCDISVEWGLIRISGKKETQTFCATHLHQYGESIIDIEPKTGSCQCCKSKSVLNVSLGNMFAYELCPMHALAYISYNLRPDDFKKLISEPVDFFLHDDFYDPRTGIAEQPDMELFDRGLDLLDKKIKKKQ